MTVFIKGFSCLLFWIYVTACSGWVKLIVRVQWCVQIPLNLLPAPLNETFLTWNLLLVYIHFQFCQMIHRWEQHCINRKGELLKQSIPHIKKEFRPLLCLPAMMWTRLSTMSPFTRIPCGNMPVCLYLHKALQLSLCPPAESGYLSCCVCCTHVWICLAAHMPAALSSCQQYLLWHTIDLPYFHGTQPLHCTNVSLDRFFAVTCTIIQDLCYWIVLSIKQQKFVK